MTTCPNEIEKWDFLNGEMDPAAAEAFTLHLQGCPECRAEIEGLRPTISELRAHPLPGVPAGLASRTKALLSGEAASLEKRGFRFSRRFTLAAGALLFAAVLTLAVMFPVHVPFEAIASFFSAPADLPLSESARELLGKILILLPLLFVPSIVENIRFFARRKHRNPPTRLRLFSI